MEASIYQEKDMFYDLEDVLAILRRKNKTVRPPSFLWSRVSDPSISKYCIWQHGNLIFTIPGL